MMKVAVFAGAIVLGFASAAQAVTVTFSGLSAGQVPNSTVAGSHSITYAAGDFYFNNADGANNFYADTTIDDVSYSNGANATWSMTITAAAGQFIQFDRF